MDLSASSGDEEWKDVLQLLEEQNEKMERLARALSVIQQGMLRNNPGFVKDSVNEANEVLSGMFNPRLLQLGKVKIGWVTCRIREHPEVARCFRCHGYGHGSRGCCNPDRKNACWRCGATGHLARSCKATPKCLTCLDRGDKDIAYVSGGSSCPVFREKLRRLRGRN